MDAEALDILRRNSGLRLDREGVFLFHEGVVPNTRVQELFHRGLQARADGELILTVGSMWCYVDHEGVTSFVQGLAFEDVGPGMTVRLRGAEPIEVRRPQLAWAPDDRFYIWLPGRVGPSVLTRNAHQQLAGRLVVRDDGALELGAVGPVTIVKLTEAPGAFAAAPRDGVDTPSPG